jgi:hypothetical protein
MNMMHVLWMEYVWIICLMELVNESISIRCVGGTPT